MFLFNRTSNTLKKKKLLQKQLKVLEDTLEIYLPLEPYINRIAEVWAEMAKVADEKELQKVEDGFYMVQFAQEHLYGNPTGYYPQLMGVLTPRKFTKLRKEIQDTKEKIEQLDLQKLRKQKSKKYDTSEDEILKALELLLK